MISTTPHLRTLAAFVRQHHLQELALENLRILAELDAPLLKGFAHLPPDDLLELAIASLEKLLIEMEEGRALEAAAENLREWEADRLEGIPRDMVTPSDMVLVAAAQKQALMGFIARLAPDAPTAMAIALDLEAFYTTTQTEAIKAFARMREQLDVRLQAAYGELQAVNDELTKQALELQAANDEFQAKAIALNEQQALTERIIENAPAGIAFLDGDLIYRQLNQAYAHLMGMTVEQVLDKSIHEVFPGATDQFEPFMRQVMATGVPYRASNFSFKFMLNGREKQTYWDFTYQPVLDQHGKTGILILEVEVSDRQARERLQTEQIEQLRELDRYKDQFLSVISHELRTPLNFITGFASTLEDEVQGPLNGRQHEAIGKILNGADRMLMLVDDLLDFAKIQSGRFDLMPTPTLYPCLVDEVLGLLKPLADQKRLSLHADVQLDGEAMLDAPRISQVLTNLINNAIKFTEPGGAVCARAYVHGGELITEVIDTGCGIAPEHHAKLFTRFEQLDMSNTRKAGGTGLGLAISKAMIEAHGGAIGVDSAPGKGSTFWFRLPHA